MKSQAAPVKITSIKYYASRLWLATSISFFLFSPYLSRYLNEENRFSFHWTRQDLFSLLFCIGLVGILFFLLFTILYMRGKDLFKKVFDLLFITTCAIALIANVAHTVNQLTQNPPHYIITIGEIVWILVGITLIWLTFRYNRRIRTFCMTLCFVLSPIIPLFIFNALQFHSYISDKGLLPTAMRSDDHNLGKKRNVYIFFFDEWSYQRSFNNKELFTEFRNLKHFMNQAIVFHKAISPWPNTFTSIPSFLFQTHLRFVVKEDRIGFTGKQFHHLSRQENIFNHARKLGFYTAMVGAAMPYGTLLNNSVDFCKSICVYKRFGDGFFNVAKYHFFTAALMLPAPFLKYERELITAYFFNRFQVNRIIKTHKLFKTIVQNQTRSTFSIFHYMIPHFPYVFNRDGHKKFFAIYEGTNISNYNGNLFYLDEKIGEIIATLKAAGKYENSLIIMTSDHSWRYDPGYDKTDWRWVFEKCHVPLFIKFPYQKDSIEIDSKFSTAKLGTIINRYLDGNFNFKEAKLILNNAEYSIPPISQ